MMLTVRDLTFAYPGNELILDRISMTISSGELVALIGANGSGKSTLLSLCSGYRVPDCGEVYLDERLVRDLPPKYIAGRMACLEQDRHLALDFTVREVVSMGRMPHQSRFARETMHDRERVDEAMVQTDIDRLADRSIHTLSGGERQRAYLAMALAQDPEILLLDEPTTHLDIRYQMDLMGIVSECTCSGLAVLVSVHDLNIAAAYADRIAMIHGGRLIANGAPTDVLTEAAIAQAFGASVAIRRDNATGKMTVIPHPNREQAILKGDRF